MHCIALDRQKFAVFILWPIIAECKSDLQKAPRNTAAFVGSDVILQCVANDSKPQKWMLNDKTVFNGYEVADALVSRFDVVQNQRGQHDLHIRNVQSSDAGQYKCGRFNASSAQLVIVGECLLHLYTQAIVLFRPTLSHLSSWVFSALTCNVKWSRVKSPSGLFTKFNSYILYHICDVYM